jgi:hypothetical protein
MNRFWVHLATGLTALVGVSVLVSACAQDSSSFFLQGVLAPPSGSSMNGCTFTSDPTQASLLGGVLDVEAAHEFSDTYEAVFLAGNQLIPTANPAQLMTETNDIVIQGAIVKITDTGTPATTMAYYTTLGAGFAYASNGTTPGYGPVEFTIVDPATVEKLRNSLGWLERETIVTYVQAFGQTLGGDNVQSNTFEYPITVCRGCLIEYFTNNFFPPNPNCFLPPTSNVSGPTVCFFGQDEPVPCYLCLSDPFCLCGGHPGLTGKAAEINCAVPAGVGAVSDGGLGGG